MLFIVFLQVKPSGFGELFDTGEYVCVWVGVFFFWVGVYVCVCVCACVYACQCTFFFTLSPSDLVRLDIYLGALKKNSKCYQTPSQIISRKCGMTGFIEWFLLLTVHHQHHCGAHTY